MHSVYACGKPEQWSVLSPNEEDGPGVMWWNGQDCGDDRYVFAHQNPKKWTFGHRVLIQFFVLFSQFDSAASIRVDFFLPYASYTKHLHRCVWQGSPERTLVPGAPSASNIKGYGAAQDGGLTRSLTFKPWTQSSEDTEIRTMANDVGNGEGDSNTVSVCHN